MAETNVFVLHSVSVLNNFKTLNNLKKKIKAVLFLSVRQDLSIGKHFL